MQISGGCGAQGPAAAHMRERLFNRADSDRSGAVSLDEFTQLARRGAANRAGGTAGSAALPADPALRDAFNSIDSDGNGQISAAEMAAAKPPVPPSGGFDSGAFNALLNSQSNEGTIRQHRRRGEHGTDTHKIQADDAALQRQLAAYQSRQAVTSGASITA